MSRKTNAKRHKSRVKKRQDASYTPEKSTYVRRTHKDKLFRFIFRDRKKLLQLYNALNKSNYQDEQELCILTLENVVYLGYKNDVAFLLDWMLFLAEHQGSWNPNMPLRGVFYFARLYQDFITEKGYDLYGKAKIPLPYPQYVVFYNGAQERPEREELKLSESFVQTGYMEGFFKDPSLECTALVLNINYGKNRELMEGCRPLWEYSCFIHYTRENIKAGCTAEEAVDLAVERCLGEDILTDVLRRHKKEVVRMFLEEYDQELHERTIRREGIEEGLEKGYEEMGELIRALLKDNRQEDLMRSLDDKEFQKKLFREYGIKKDKD